MSQKPGVPVSERAVIARINRKLKQDDEVLKATRGERARLDLGDYHVVNYRGNYVAQMNCDPERLGRELGVLKPFEKVVP